MNNMDCTELISVFAHCNATTEIWDLLKFMDKEGIEMDHITYAELSASTHLNDHDLGLHIHERIRSRGVHLTGLLQTSILKMYLKCFDLETTVKVFTEWRNQKQEINTITLNTLIAGVASNSNNVALSTHGELNKAFELLKEMLLHGKADDITWIALLRGCAEKQDIILGKTLHTMLLKHNIIFSTTLYNALLNFYAKCDLEIDR